MEQTILYQRDLEKLLNCFDVLVVVEHLSSKGFLCDHERKCMDSLKTKREIVSYLHQILKADPSRSGEFLDEFDVIAREHLSNILNHILELKKTRKKSRVFVRAEKRGCHSESVPTCPLLELKLSDMKNSSLTDCPNDSFEHVSIIIGELIV